MESSDRERTKFSRIYSIPHIGSNHFVGREEQLAELHRSLQQTRRVAVTAVAGMGGVGKTELVVQYAFEHEAEYPGGVCWLVARESDSTALAAQILQQIKRQGQELPELSLDEQVRWGWENWQPSGKVLVILDDVVRLEGYRSILPKLPRFCVVMTTRVRSIDVNFHNLSLDVLPDDKALELLRKLLKDDGRIDREPEAAEQLCEALGNLPLGLELVGRYLAKYRTLSIAEMLKRLQIEAEALKRDPRYYMTAQRGVKAAFDLTWQALNPAAQEVALLLSWFALAKIPWYLVEWMMQRVRGEDYALIEPMIELDNAFLIQPVEEATCRTYKLHPLVREFLRQQREAVGQQAQYEQAFVNVLVIVASHMPQVPTREVIAHYALVWPHLEVIAQTMTHLLDGEDLVWAFVALARFFEGQGLYTLAEPWYRQCLSAMQSRFGVEHLLVAASLNNLGALYQFQGRFSEAELLHVQALALSKQLLGDEHLHVASSLNNLAMLYKFQGRYSEAEPLFLQALALHKQLLGDQHSDVAISLNNLALLYESQSRYSEAEALHVQALALRRKLLGDEHPDVAASLNNLASLYDSQGRYSEAELLYVEALALHKQLLGNEHPLVAISLHNLAILYSSQGRYSEAEPLFVQALTLRRKLLGDEHPDVASNINGLAELYYLQSRYSKAEPLFMQALMIFEQRLGENHPNTVKVRRNLEGFRQQMQAANEAFLRSRSTPTRRTPPTLAQQIRSILTHLLRRIRRLFQRTRSPR